MDPVLVLRNWEMLLKFCEINPKEGRMGGGVPLDHDRLPHCLERDKPLWGQLPGLHFIPHGGLSGHDVVRRGTAVALPWFTGSTNSQHMQKAHF